MGVSTQSTWGVSQWTPQLAQWLFEYKFVLIALSHIQQNQFVHRDEAKKTPKSSKKEKNYKTKQRCPAIFHRRIRSQSLADTPR